MAIRTVLTGGSSHVAGGPITMDITVLGLLTVVVAAIIASGPPSWTRLAAAWWLACALLLAYSDATTHRLSLGLVALMSAGTLLLLLGAATPSAWIRAIAVGCGLGLAVLLLCLPRNGLGLGDAAIAVPIGIALGWTGWPALALWLLTASLLLSATATILLALGRVTRRSRLPLAPYLLLAVLPAVLL
jgi:leader peptidase (prepilin peptidase) / N-methyltransferase